MENKKNILIIDLENESSLQKALVKLISDIENVSSEKKFHSFDYEFGAEVEGQFIRFENLKELEEYKTMEEIHSSELPFFLATTKHPHLIPIVEKYIQKIIQKGNAHYLWSNDENPVGLQATFSLAFVDKAYLELYQQLLMHLDMDHEVYQADQISVLAQKWGDTTEFLSLLAARCTSICGQHGSEQFEYLIEEDYIPELLSNSEKKQAFIQLLFKEAKLIKFYLKSPQPEEVKLAELSQYFLIPAFEILNTPITEDEIIAQLKNV
ncbi:hypothetical protein ACWGOQ_0022525 [Aquimarina sp. M1]